MACSSECALLCGFQIADLKGASDGVEQQSQAATLRAKHEQQHLHEQNARLTAELAAVTEDRYELQVNLEWNKCMQAVSHTMVHGQTKWS